MDASELVTLEADAAEWRRRALHGDREARGVAHLLETELRRRSPVAAAASPALDMRPLWQRQPTRRWWKLW